MKEQTEKDIFASRNQIELDAAGKRLFMNREILAPILQQTVEEYQKLSIEEIVALIEPETISSEVAVEEIRSEDMNIVGDTTELSSISDKIIRYDVHFHAKNPELSAKKRQDIMLHFDFELQNNYQPSNPSYPIPKRAVYYAARELSSQLGTLTRVTDYSKLQKAYSIWVCSRNIPQSLQNTVTKFSFSKQDLFGKSDDLKENYDLMEVILIRRGEKPPAEEGVLDYLDALFRADIAGVNHYVDIENKGVIVEEMKRMDSLWEVAVEEGVRKGIEQGRKQGVEQGGLVMLYNLVQNKAITLSIAAQSASLSESDFIEALRKIGYEF